MNGNPLKVGQVTAYNDKNEPVARVMVVDGRYEMTNVPVGEVTLVVQTHTPDGQPITSAKPPPRHDERAQPTATVKKDGEETPAKVDPVPLKYTSQKQSGLKVAVVKGLTTFDIAMTGKGEIPRAPLPSPGGPQPGPFPPGHPPPGHPPFPPGHPPMPPRP